MKAITPIVGLIMFLTITLGIASFAFTFFSGILGTTTESGERQITNKITQSGEKFKIANIYENVVSIENAGANNIPVSSLAFFVDNEEKSAVPSCSGSIESGRVCHFTIQDVSPGTYLLTVSGLSNVKKIQMTVPCHISSSSCSVPDGSISCDESISGCLNTDDWKYYLVTGSADKIVNVTLTYSGSGCNFNDLYIYNYFDSVCDYMYSSMGNLWTKTWSSIFVLTDDIIIGIRGESTNDNCQWTLNVTCDVLGT